MQFFTPFQSVTSIYLLRCRHVWILQKKWMWAHHTSRYLVNKVVVLKLKPSTGSRLVRDKFSCFRTWEANDWKPKTILHYNHMAKGKQWVFIKRKEVPCFHKPCLTPHPTGRKSWFPIWNPQRQFCAHKLLKAGQKLSSRLKWYKS